MLSSHYIQKGLLFAKPPQTENQLGLLRIFKIIKSIFSYFIGFLLNKTPYFYNNDYVFMGS
jgi:hypothetical protein